MLHTAQVNVEMKEPEVMQLSQEEQEAVDQMFAIIMNRNKDNSATQAKKFQSLLQQYPGIVHQKKYDTTALISATKEHDHLRSMWKLYRNIIYEPIWREANGSINPKIIQMLIAANADLNVQDCRGTALMQAVREKETNIIQMLIAAGADKDIQFIKSDIDIAGENILGEHGFPSSTALDIAIAHNFGDEYRAAIKAGEKQKLRYEHARQTACKEVEKHILPELAKIVSEYAFNPQNIRDLPVKSNMCVIQ